jgi:hypothetical protein
LTRPPRNCLWRTFTAASYFTSPWTDSFSHKPSGWMRQCKGSLLNEPGSHAIWVS